MCAMWVRKAQHSPLSSYIRDHPGERCSIPLRAAPCQRSRKGSDGAVCPHASARPNRGTELPLSNRCRRWYPAAHQPVKVREGACIQESTSGTYTHLHGRPLAKAVQLLETVIAVSVQIALQLATDALKRVRASILLVFRHVCVGHKLRAQLCVEGERLHLIEALLLGYVVREEQIYFSRSLVLSLLVPEVRNAWGMSAGGRKIRAACGSGSPELPCTR